MNNYRRYTLAERYEVIRRIIIRQPAPSISRSLGRDPQSVYNYLSGKGIKTKPTVVTHTPEVTAEKKPWLVVRWLKARRAVLMVQVKVIDGLVG